MPTREFATPENYYTCGAMMGQQAYYLFEINFRFAHLKGLEILAPKEFRYIAIASENTTTNPPQQQTNSSLILYVETV